MCDSRDTLQTDHLYAREVLYFTGTETKNGCVSLQCRLRPTIKLVVFASIFDCCKLSWPEEFN